MTRRQKEPARAEPPGFTPVERTALRRALRTWFQRSARDLPWRRTADPYAIWISEIMLQQTQVATVIPYFERFLRDFPSLRDLAAASEEQVLRHWEGLGYYRRARQLHRAAQACVLHHGGEFPTTFEEVLALPGIGRYTAGAIVSFAFDQPAPILEANTLRVQARLIGYTGDPHATSGQKALWQAATDILPRRGAGIVNQALMELGALVCLPQAPRCDVCPVAAWCRAKQQGCQGEIPRPKAKPRITAVYEAAIALRCGDQVLLRQRPAGERWAGLWDFLRWELPEPEPLVVTPPPLPFLQPLLTVAPRQWRHWTTLRHSVTRYRITLDCWSCQVPRSDVIDEREFEGAPWQWVPVSELPQRPMHVTARKFAQLLLG